MGIRVANKRIAVTPVSMLTEGARGNPVDLGKANRSIGAVVGVDFVGGYSGAGTERLHQKRKLTFSIRFPKRSLRLSVCVDRSMPRPTRAGINMDAVARVGKLIKDAAERTRDRGGLACAKLCALPTPSKTIHLWPALFMASASRKPC
jgi:uncharacterized protein (UPF0210 family)